MEPGNQLSCVESRYTVEGAKIGMWSWEVGEATPGTKQMRMSLRELKSVYLYHIASHSQFEV